jgi:hypothetical protein
MGACTFGNVVVTKGNSSKAYNEICDEMKDYNGHQEGYSGDIQTTDGFYTARETPRYGTKAFNKWEDEQLDKLNKRECLCVEIKSPSELKRLKGDRWKGKRGVRAFYFFGWAAC